MGEVSSGRFATNDVGLRRDQMSGGQCGKPQRAVNSFPILGPVPAPFESGNKNLPSLVFPTDTGFYFLESIGYRLSFESLSSSFSAFGTSIFAFFSLECWLQKRSWSPARRSFVCERVGRVSLRNFRFGEDFTMLPTPKSARFLAAFVFSLILLPSIAIAQYVRTDLVTNATDPNLVNGWGLTRSGGSPFWVSDNGTGKSTLYNGTGQGFPVGSPLVVTIPPAPVPGSTAKGTPTGIVFNITLGNPTPSFSVSNGSTIGPAIFLFDTLDGTISGWSPGVDPTNAIIAVDRSSFGAVYTGLAITTARTAALMFSTRTSNW